ncbi:hypothetical protein AVEN_112731-1 [Araneus ventricosus]|uniref:Uncharacterized protein n=1 Tax=Araneus ventricosus TaxID=182803 RepID=A0A4Y2WPH2_ARAVE|nr:hypothetical protein AVEN_112731-1 [Araneus ventricosus]
MQTSIPILSEFLVTSFSCTDVVANNRYQCELRILQLFTYSYTVSNIDPRQLILSLSEFGVLSSTFRTTADPHALTVFLFLMDHFSFYKRSYIVKMHLAAAFTHLRTCSAYMTYDASNLQCFLIGIFLMARLIQLDVVEYNPIPVRARIAALRVFILTESRLIRSPYYTT